MLTAGIGVENTGAELGAFVTITVKLLVEEACESLIVTVTVKVGPTYAGEGAIVRIVPEILKKYIGIFSVGPAV